MNSPITKEYNNTSVENRQEFIRLVTLKQSTIKVAAIKFGIKFSTAKHFLRQFRKEGRIGKKSYRSKKI